MTKAMEEKVKRGKAKILWLLILETPGTEDLEDPLRRLARFEELSPAHRKTLDAVVAGYEVKAHALEAEAKKRSLRDGQDDQERRPSGLRGVMDNGQGQTIEAEGIEGEIVEIIPPGQAVEIQREEESDEIG